MILARSFLLIFGGKVWWFEDDDEKFPKIIKATRKWLLKWVVTYTACPLGKLTRIAKSNLLTLQR
jgi:hypothetical protein